MPQYRHFLLSSDRSNILAQKIFFGKAKISSKGTQYLGLSQETALLCWDASSGA
jgi:hypothetical protein